MASAQWGGGNWGAKNWSGAPAGAPPPTVSWIPETSTAYRNPARRWYCTRRPEGTGRLVALSVPAVVPSWIPPPPAVRRLQPRPRRAAAGGGALGGKAPVVWVPQLGARRRPLRRRSSGPGMRAPIGSRWIPQPTGWSPARRLWRILDFVSAGRIRSFRRPPPPPIVETYPPPAPSAPANSWALHRGLLATACPPRELMADASPRVLDAVDCPQRGLSADAAPRRLEATARGS